MSVKRPADVPGVVDRLNAAGLETVDISRIEAAQARGPVCVCGATALVVAAPGRCMVMFDSIAYHYTRPKRPK
jgi:hypothetical protein